METDLPYTRGSPPRGCFCSITAFLWTHMVTAQCSSLSCDDTIAVSGLRAERMIITLSRSIALGLHFLAWLFPTTPTLSLLHQNHLSVTLFLWSWAYDSRLALCHHAETPFGDPWCLFPPKPLVSLLQCTRHWFVDTYLLCIKTILPKARDTPKRTCCL